MEPAEGQPVPQFYYERSTLPYLKPPKQKINLWSVLKNSIGKDLTKITLPVNFNEPMSMLQKTQEFMEYEHLLAEAADGNENDPKQRLLKIILFQVS